MEIVLSDELEELNYLRNIGEEIFNLLHYDEWHSPSLKGFEQSGSFPPSPALNQHLHFPPSSIIVILPQVALELLVVDVDGVDFLGEVGNDVLLRWLADYLLQIYYFSTHRLQLSHVDALFCVELGLASAEELDLLGLLKVDVG